MRILSPCNYDKYPEHELQEGLHGQVKNCSVAALEELVSDKQGNLDLQTEKGKLTPLMVAAKHNNRPVVEKLLEWNANPQARSSDKAKAISLAAEDGHTEIVTLLAEHHRDQEDTLLDALHLACKYGHAETADALLAHGASINCRIPGTKGKTVLIVAAHHGHLDVVDRLLTHKANVADESEDGTTALMLASRFGHPEVVAALLGAEGGTSIVDNGCTQDFTSLMRAAGNGHVEVTTKLLEHITDINKWNKSGTTALMAACRSGYSKSIALLLRKDNSGINMQDREGKSALFLAASGGHDGALRQLLTFHHARDVEIEIDLADENGTTPLMAACEAGHVACVRQLLQAKADVNKQRTHDQVSALMLAVTGGMDTVRVLLQQQKLDFFQKDKDGSTALIMAKKSNEAICKLLQEYRTVVFESMQQTQLATDMKLQWLGGRLPESVKASLPRECSRGSEPTQPRGSLPYIPIDRSSVQSFVLAGIEHPSFTCHSIQHEDAQVHLFSTDGQCRHHTCERSGLRQAHPCRSHRDLSERGYGASRGGVGCAAPTLHVAGRGSV